MYRESANSVDNIFVYADTLKSVSFLGYNVCDESYDRILEYLRYSVFFGEKHILIAFNPKKVALASADSDVHKALKEADILIPDGFGIVLASKLIGAKIKRRVTGTDTVWRICADSKLSKAGMFIYGAEPDSLKDAVERLTKNGVVISGAENGYDSDEDKVISLINESKAKILLVALGSPKQELFIHKNKEKLEHVKLVMGVGGTIDVVSGHVKRAPAPIRKLGLEWVFRMICQPSRINENKSNISKYIKIIMRERRKKSGN